MTTLQDLFARAAERHGGMAAFARRAGVSRQALYLWQTGQRQPSAAAVAKLAKALRLSQRWIRAVVAGEVPSYDE